MEFSKITWRWRRRTVSNVGLVRKWWWRRKQAPSSLHWYLYSISRTDIFCFFNFFLVSSHVAASAWVPIEAEMEIRGEFGAIDVCLRIDKPPMFFSTDEVLSCIYYYAPGIFVGPYYNGPPIKPRNSNEPKKSLSNYFTSPAKFSLNYSVIFYYLYIHLLWN